MADPPSGDRPQYNVYKAGSDAPPRGTPPPPPGQAPQQPQPEQPRQPDEGAQQQQQQPPQQPSQAPAGAPQYRTYKSRRTLKDRLFPAGLPGRGRKRGDDQPRPQTLKPPR